MGKRESHPRLRGGRKKREDDYKYKNGLSSFELHSLASIFEALWPPLLPSTAQRDTVKFYFESAPSQDPSLLQECGEILRKRGPPEAVVMVRCVLWLLGTRLGTLLLCGRLCLGKRWPFISRFSDLTVENREKILLGWAGNRFFGPIRVVFFLLKCLSLYILFSMVDENSHNPLWEAIGYQVDKSDTLRNTHKHRPLQNGIVETLYETPSSLLYSLTQKNLHVTDDPTTYTIQCDVVIIGSGCGGGVAAATLAAAGQKVVVLEKGNYYTAPDYSSLEGPSMDELLESGGMLPSSDGSLMLLAGSTVGGGSAVNWAASIKTPVAVMEEWARDRGLPLFGGPQYLFAMDAVFERLGVTDKCPKEGFQNQVLRKGCENMGLRADRVPRNSSEDHYCGSCQYGCRSGSKQGTDVTWLVDAVEKGTVVITGCKAEKLLMVENSDGRPRRQRCIGVVAKSMNESITKRLRIEAKVTITACGALFTPPLLVASGLKNKHIGHNLHLHPTLMVWGYFPESNPDFEGRVYEGGLITTAHAVFEGDGPNPKVRALIETPALGPASCAAISPWRSGLDMKAWMRRYSRTARLFVMVKDEGTGEVMKEGRIHYKLAEIDKENLTAGLRRALRILIAAGAVEVGTYRSDNQRIKCKGVSNEELDQFIDSVQATNGPMWDSNWSVYCTAHQMGSCKMGKSAEEGAVDEKGQSWEAEGLFVVDASVLPGAVGVNPMITIQSTAYCISKRLAESLKNREFS